MDSKTENTVTDKTVANTITHQIARVRHAARELRRIAANVRERAERVEHLAEVLEGRQDNELVEPSLLNSLGELQMVGLEFDRLCAVIPERQEMLAVLLHIRDAN